MRPFFATVILLACVLAQPAALAQPADAPKDPPLSQTDYQIDAQRSSHLAEAMAHTYEASKWHDPKWDAAVHEIHAAAAKWVIGGFTPTERTTTAAKILKCMNQGCKDPLLIGFRAQLMGFDGDDKAADINQLAMADLPDSGYPPMFIAEAAITAARTAGNAHDQAKSAALRQLAADALMKIALDDSIPGPLGLNNRFELLHPYLEHKERGLTRALFKAAVIKEPKISPWLREMILGNCEVTDAWLARGDGWADTVTKDGWQKFERHLVNARGHLEEAYKLQPTLPQPCSIMISVAMAGHAREGQDIQFWFDRAATARIDYYPAYTAMLWALRPRWGGTHKEMLDLGLKAAALNRPDTNLAWVLADAIKDIDDDTENIHAVLALPGVWPALDRAFNAMFDDPAHKDDQTDIIATHIAAASAAGEDAIAQQLCAKQAALKLPLQNHVIAEWRLDSIRLGHMNSLLASAFRDQALKAVDAQHNAKWGEASDIYTKIADDLGGKPGSEFFLRRAAVDCAALTAIRQAVADGAKYCWSQRDPKDTEVPALRTFGGFWSFNNGDIQGATRDGLKAFVPVPLGSRYEVSVTIDARNAFIAQPNAKDQFVPLKTINGGIVIGAQTDFDTSRWAGVRVSFGDNALLIGTGWTEEKRIPLPDLGTSASLRVQVWDEQIAAYVNDKEYYRGTITRPSPWGPLVGIGAKNDQPLVPHLLFRNFCIGPLKDPPAWLRELGRQGPQEAPKMKTPHF